MIERRFSWSRYLLRRLTRLWIVIIPALLLTLALDNIGMALGAKEVYDGSRYGIYVSGPSDPANHSPVAFFGNFAFLQTICVPIFGTNGPMWSLANEFWYYLIFPLTAWLAIARATLIWKVTGLATVLAAFALLPISLVLLGVIWVAGALAAGVAHRPALVPLLTHMVVRTGGVVAILSTMALARGLPNSVGDFELGIVVAAVLPILATMPSLGRTYRVVTLEASKVSYTLYLTHFPLLTFFAAVCLTPERLPSSISAFVAFTALCVVAVSWAWLIWWCFERRTDHFYSLIARSMGGRFDL